MCVTYDTLVTVTYLSYNIIKYQVNGIK